MEIVVDTSALIAVLVGEPQRDGIIARTRGQQLVCPAALPWEIGNAFSAMLKRKRASREILQRAWDIFQTIPIRYDDANMKQVLLLVEQYHIYAYDAYFLDCALRHQSPLLTLDFPLRRVAHTLAIEVLEF